MNKGFQDLVTYVESLPEAKKSGDLIFRAVQASADDALYFLGIEIDGDPEEFWRKTPPRPDSGKRNVSNRPYGVGTAKGYGLAVLAGEFELTGETGVLGDHCSILNCQHRLGGLLWARHLWQKAKDNGTLDDKYPLWADHPPFINLCLVLGVPEIGKVVNKMDTGRSRSNSDVIYRDYNFSQRFDGKDRVKLSRIVSQSARLVWGRMNGKTIRATPKMDQREMMTFVHHHPGIVAMIEFLYIMDIDEEDPGCVSRKVPLSVLAGLGYLMSTARTKPLMGRSNPEEIDYSLLDDAKKFIRLVIKGEGLVAGNPILILRNALEAFKGAAGKKERDDRVRMTVISWNYWIDGKRSGLSLSDLKPDPEADPRIGGLDTSED